MDTVSNSRTAIYRHNFQQRLTYQRERRESTRQKALMAVKQTISTIAAAIPSVENVYLFGSIIHPGRFRQDSDIDIAVTGTTAAEYFAFWQNLEEALPEWKIDLRDVTDDSYFSKRVIETGVLLYERSDSTATS